MTAVFRFEIPVDDQWHAISMTDAPVLHVASRNARAVEFWSLNIGLPQTRRFQVFGTGHPIDPVFGRFNPQIVYCGTAIPLDLPGLVWHLFEDVR